MAIVYAISILTFICCLILTPIVIKMCKKYELVDIPKDNRRVHSKPMPRCGGIAIVISTLLGLAVYYFITKNIPSIALNRKFVGFVIGGLIIFIMGLIDDVWNLRPKYKFFFQLAAGITVYYFGIRISVINVPFLNIDTINLAQWVDFLLTMAWVISITNAMNLIDGLDGLAAGICSIAATALLIVFITTSASLEAIIITAALVGATLGFLPYNFNPAKTFMGDCSSNFLGFTMSIVSILGFAKGYTMIAIVAPVLVLGVPIFDTLFAMIRRILKGQPPLKPDGAHIHHRLIKRGFSQRQAVLILYTITSILCIVAVSIISADIWKLIILIVMSILFIVFGLISIKNQKENHTSDETVSQNFSNEEEKKEKV